MNPPDQDAPSPVAAPQGGINLQRIGIAVLFSLTLGLAPFTPEPHLVGKLRWVAGGAVGMAPMDWIDLAMHGAPFAMLAWVLITELGSSRR